MRSKVTVGEVELGYELVGKGEKTLLLLAGAIGSARSDFSSQLEYWRDSEAITVVAIDGRGYGTSRPPDRNFEKDFYRQDADDAFQLMQILGYEKYSIFGWSDGANVAAIIAANHPGSVRKIVLCGGNAFMTSDDVAIMKEIRDLKTWDEDSLKPMVEEYGIEYFESTWHKWVDHWVGLSDELNGKIIDLYTKDLCKIECDVMVVHGEKDDLVPLSHGTYLNENIKHSRLRVWKEGDHNLHMKFSSDLNQEVENFISE